jgi:hypothetical protein
VGSAHNIVVLAGIAFKLMIDELRPKLNSYLKSIGNIPEKE